MVEVTVKGILNQFQDTIMELQEEPEFKRGNKTTKYMLDNKGKPQIKVAIGNVPLNYDLWEGLRNPAVIGLYPAGLREIWEFYANRRKQKVDEYGRQTIFQTLQTFEHAQKIYKRAVIISTMLPFSEIETKDYVKIFSEKSRLSSYKFVRMRQDIDNMLEKALSRVAIDLVSRDNIIIPMDNSRVKDISTEAIPKTHQGISHGPSKSVNYPQKSIAALMGLGQFGISRFIFRDELVNGKVERFVGPIRSIVMFDQNDLVTDGANDIIYPTKTWRDFLTQLYDFTNINPEINKYRFCTYIPYNDKGCGKCIDNCPPGAQANSVPETDGKFSKNVEKQTHRFYNGKLQFDAARCCEDRGQMSSLFSEWSCQRCISICNVEGNRRKYAAKKFHEKMKQLTKLN